DDSLVFFNDTVILVEVTNSQASGAASLDIKIAKTDLPYVTPPDAKQPNDHTFDTNDGRMLGALEFDDEIQYVASTMDTSTGMPVIYHGFVTDFKTANPSVHGQMITHPYLELGYPNMSWTGNQQNQKELIIAFNH